MEKSKFKEEIRNSGVEKISPLKAIRKFCIECSGESSYEVERCTSKNCFLYPFRFGYNPFSEKTVSDEQKQAARERLKNYYSNRKENNNEED